MKLQHDVRKAVAVIEDTANETKHRIAAETEKQKRETLGDALTPGEKAKSVLNETKNTVQANVDAAKKKYDQR
jgi:prophage DNA circulation protein